MNTKTLQSQQVVDATTTEYDPEYEGAFYHDDDVDDAEYEASPRSEWVKPSAYVPGTKPNQLREPYAEMMRLSEREAQNIPRMLFQGVRPKTELPNEQTPREIYQTRTPYGLRRSVIEGVTFYSKKDLLYHAKNVARTYGDFEIIGGENGQFYFQILWQCGYIDEHVSGSVFFAPVKTKFAERVLCFIRESDEVVTAEFLDVVIRNVPSTPVAPAEVPREYYRGKRRVSTKAERENARRANAEHREYMARKAAAVGKVKSYRIMLEMGYDPVAEAREQLAQIRALLNPGGADKPHVSPSAESSQTGYDDNFFDAIDAIS